MNLPYWLLRLLPMWDYICPRCKREVPRKSRVCPHCGEAYHFPLGIPPRMLKDPVALGEYVHRNVFPRVSAKQREYLALFFTTIFSDGFESGDTSAWTGVLGSPTVQSTTKHHGTYGLYCDARGEGVYKTFTEVTKVYGRAYVYITQWGATVQGVLRLFRNTWDSCCQAVIELTNHFWRLIVNQPSETITSSVAASLSTWYCVQLAWQKSTAGGAEMWVHDDTGTELVHITCTVTTNNYPCTRFDVFNTDSAYGTPQAYYDCAKIADAYIDPETAAPPPAAGILVQVI